MFPTPQSARRQTRAQGSARAVLQRREALQLFNGLAEMFSLSEEDNLLRQECVVLPSCPLRASFSGVSVPVSTAAVCFTTAEKSRMQAKARPTYLPTAPESHGMSVSAQRRVLSKDGHNNARVDNLEGKMQLYLHDIWTTVLDMKWRYKLTLFISTFFTTWFAFGILYYLIGLKNGDIDIPPTSNHTPCIANVATLTSAYLFSLESQTTIGYGFRHINEECSLAILALVVQLVMTGLAEIFVTGAFLAKLARPKKRAESVRFSRYAVVCARQGKACVMVRVANMRNSLLVQCQINGKLLSPYITEEGEKNLLHQVPVNFRLDSSDEWPFLVVPLTFYHELDESSPLAGLTAESLKTSDFELVLSLSASTESTGTFCQCRTSYTPQEFLWDCEFEPLIFVAPRGRPIIDFGFFDKVQASMESSLLQNPKTEKLRLEDEYRRE
ncbi:hypothetical protein P4O66_000230 [Electrophorus voltai]|uniref:Potassium inwardly rectifying channel subfamily J member 15 n=1 Tax=Electrophorus voltai TaxID=2609070 RepID=A0AAD8ZIQ1_9TELE|nr:hypothetical protein P4O66_000230 [Electrophorus voltai]